MSRKRSPAAQGTSSRPGPLFRLSERLRAHPSVDPFLLLALFALVCGPYLYRACQTAIPGGWDGVPHYAIADLYARNIFPAISGWMPEYFAGMPYPDFYPPVFYFSVAALTKGGLSTRDAFLLVQVLASAAVPLLSYLCARRLSGTRVGGVVAGLLATGYLVHGGALSRLGIALRGTFDAGLSTQLLGHCMVLLFYYAFLSALEDRRWAAASALFLALVPLTNVHMVWVAALLFVTLSATQLVMARSHAERLRVLAVHAAIGVVSLLLSACWVVPMLARLKYVPTLALDPVPPGVAAFLFFRLSVYLLCGFAAALLERNARAIALAVSLLLLLVLSVLPARYLSLSDVALQPGRLAVAFPFLMTFLVGYLVGVAGKLWSWPLAQPAVALACAAFFFLHFKLESAPTGNVTDTEMTQYENVLRTLNGRTDGRVITEMDRKGSQNPFALQALVGASGGHSLTTVFRESSVNVLFTVPMRNRFSTENESFGVDSKVGADDFETEWAQELTRLRLFNVRYFAVQSEEMKEKLAALPGVRRESPEGRWELYALEAPAPGLASVPAYAPVLTFAPFSVKRRPNFSFDFVRLGEEMLASGQLEVPLVLARSGRLDREEDWERFRTALVTEYRYEDAERAYAALEHFSRDRHLLLLESEDPLYARLAKLAPERKTVHLIPTLADRPAPSSAGVPPGRRAVAEQRAARTIHRRLLEVLDAVKEPVGDVPGLKSARLEGERLELELDAEPSRPVPVWVRQGYFPTWTNPEGEPVYMATPTFQLTFVRQREATVRIQRGGLERGSALLSVAGLALVVGGVVTGRRRKAERSAPPG
jgi:hypothetical protein